MNVKTASIADFNGKVQKIETLKKDQRDREVRELLEKACRQVEPVMKNRQWTVGLVQEFYPKDKKLQGLNENRGEVISIRVRREHDVGELYHYEHVLGTLLHELVHIVHGPHNAKFYALLEQITEECEKVVLGGFMSQGQRLNHGRHNPSQNEARRLAAEAAEKRARMRELTGGSGGRGWTVGGTKEKGLSPREAVAIAAIRREEDLMSCGTGKN